MSDMLPCYLTKMKKAKRKSKKELKDIGGTKLEFKNTTIDLDPDKDLCLIEHEEKGQEAYYKGQKMKYLDYYAELADREQKYKAGKDVKSNSLGLFGGFGEGKLKKPYKE